MQNEKGGVKFPWVALAVAVAIAAAWGYKHRGPDDVVVQVPRHIVEKPNEVRVPAARESIAVATRKLEAKNAAPPAVDEPLRLHPLDEPDPERNADPAQVEKRDEVERKIHAAQHVE